MQDSFPSHYACHTSYTFSLKSYSAFTSGWHKLTAMGCCKMVCYVFHWRKLQCFLFLLLDKLLNILALWQGRAGQSFVTPPLHTWTCIHIRDPGQLLSHYCLAWNLQDDDHWFKSLMLSLMSWIYCTLHYNVIQKCQICQLCVTTEKHEYCIWKGIVTRMQTAAKSMYTNNTLFQ